MPGLCLWLLKRVLMMHRFRIEFIPKTFWPPNSGTKSNYTIMGEMFARCREETSILMETDHRGRCLQVRHYVEWAS